MYQVWQCKVVLLTEKPLDAFDSKVREFIELNAPVGPSLVTSDADGTLTFNELALCHERYPDAPEFQGGIG